MIACTNYLINSIKISIEQLLKTFSFSFSIFSVWMVYSFLFMSEAVFIQRWLLCQGCSGSGSRIFPHCVGSHLLSKVGRDRHLLHPPPAGQPVSRGGCCSAA